METKTDQGQHLARGLDPTPGRNLHQGLDRDRNQAQNQAPGPAPCQSLRQAPDPDLAQDQSRVPGLLPDQDLTLVQDRDPNLALVQPRVQSLDRDQVQGPLHDLDLDQGRGRDHDNYYQQRPISFSNTYNKTFLPNAHFFLFFASSKRLHFT